MSLSELLARKMVDYGYRSAKEMADDLGVDPVHLRRFMRGEPYRMGIKMRQAITSKLDVDPGILSALEANTNLKPYEVETLIAFRRSGMCYKKAAKELCVHPTTVSYRLLAIKNHTGKDPRIWENLRAMTEGWME